VGAFAEAVKRQGETMQIGIMPFVIVTAGVLLALAGWALFRTFDERRTGRRISARHAIVLMTCCTALWLGVCFFSMVWTALGHSAHPWRDSWPQCLVSFVVLVLAPGALLIFLATRRAG
jgi:cytochrome bd-type quinol oxidase subunit 2